MRRTTFSVGALALFGLMLCQTENANAQVNEPPPAGAILDLAGQPLPTTLTQYTVSFTASLTTTDITLAFRDDPALLLLENVQVTDTTTGSPTNLLTNGDFSGGTYPVDYNYEIYYEPDDWTYDDQYSAQADGGVQGSEYVDGSVQGYDAITQAISTSVGNTYQISFYLSESNAAGNHTFQDLSTNGDVTDDNGNGIDVLVYAQAGVPAPGNVPEPSSVVLLLTTVLGVGFVLRKRIASGA